MVNFKPNAIKNYHLTILPTMKLRKKRCWAVGLRSTAQNSQELVNWSWKQPFIKITMVVRFFCIIMERFWWFITMVIYQESRYVALHCYTTLNRLFQICSVWPVILPMPNWTACVLSRHVGYILGYPQERMADFFEYCQLNQSMDGKKTR